MLKSSACDTKWLIHKYRTIYTERINVLKLYALHDVVPILGTIHAVFFFFDITVPR